MNTQTRILFFGAALCAALTFLNPLVIEADPGTTHLFELDGDAIDPNTDTLPDDWGTHDGCIGGTDSCGFVVGPSGDPNVTGGSSTVSVFLADATDSTDDVHAGGGSKDDLPLRGWKWKSGSVSDKTNIAEAMAAAYIDNGRLIIFFGSSLIAENGDANASYWFLQENVDAVGGKFVCPNKPSNEDCHTKGDVLVQANFSNGGTIATIGVFEWVGDGTGDIAPKGNLNTRFSGQARCTNSPGAPTLACAIVNDSGTEDAPDTWNHEAKSPVDFVDATEPNTDTDDYPETTFFEGGIDISEAFNADICVSTFLAGTRSSTSVRSIREDFALRSFNTCGVDLTASCELGGPNDDGLNADQTAFVYEFDGTVFATAGTVYDVEIYDMGADLDDTSDDTLVASFASVNTDGDVWDSYEIETTVNGASRRFQAIAAAEPDGEQTIVSDSFPLATCPVIDLDPMVSITKECRTCLAVESNMVKVTVHARGNVCNTGDLKLNSVTVTDDRGTPDDDEDDLTISLGNIGLNKCKPYTLNYAPVDSDSAYPGLATFSDGVSVSASTSLGFAVEDASAGATCPLCPDPDDPALEIECPALD